MIVKEIVFPQKVIFRKNDHSNSEICMMAFSYCRKIISLLLLFHMQLVSVGSPYTDVVLLVVLPADFAGF